MTCTEQARVAKVVAVEGLTIPTVFAATDLPTDGSVRLAWVEPPAGITMSSSASSATYQRLLFTFTGGSVAGQTYHEFNPAGSNPAKAVPAGWLNPVAPH